MKVVVQRSGLSKVVVNDKIVGSINKGLVLLTCFEKGDEPSCYEKAAQKILKLRIFADENGKMNKSITDIGGSILNISQFTLSWSGQKGNRPSFDGSMEPQKANEYFEKFCQLLKQEAPVEIGSFGDHMDVSITNDGPVTFFLEF